MASRPEEPGRARRDVERLIEELYQHGKLEQADDMPITVIVPERRTPYLRPYVTSVEHPFVQLVQDVLHDMFGSVEYNYGLSVADENYLGAVLGRGTWASWGGPPRTGRVGIPLQSRRTHFCLP
jgi:hypothetical protein